jgi:heme/copper-type cytochrome/quinol oxidase subunit 2
MTADEILRLLDELGARLEGPGRYVFDLTVRQVVVGGILGLVVGIALWVVVLAMVVMIIVLIRRYEETENKKSYYDSDNDGIAASLLVVLALVVALFATAVTFTSLMSLLNPEYTALANLVSLIRGPK